MSKKLKIGSGFSLKRLDLAVKSLANTSFLGNYKSAFKGAGLEFESYRKYDSNNDDSSRIDWKASRRVNNLLVKEFKEERDIEIFFLIDVSSSMLTGSTKSLKAEYVAELVSTLSKSVLIAGDSVGFLFFSDRIIRESMPKRDLSQFYALTNELAKVSNYGGYGDVNKALSEAYNKIPEGSLVILISDFVRGIESERTLKLASKKFDLILMMVRDPRDMTLPSGEGEIFLEDPHSGTTLLVRPEKIRKEFARQVISEISSLQNKLRKYGADFLFLSTDKPYVGEITKFFRVREQKWR